MRVVLSDGERICSSSVKLICGILVIFAFRGQRGGSLPVF